MKAVAIILAAGKSQEKMPHPKANIEHEGGKSFLQSLASTFVKAGCGVLGVVGSDAAAVREQHPSLMLVTNEHWERSLLASVKVGLEAALQEARGADPENAVVVMVHPVDMPALRVNTVKTLLKEMERGDMKGAAALRPEYDSAVGWPVVLSQGAAEKLLQAEGEDLETALKAFNPRRLSVKDPGVIVNINTPGAYERVFGKPPVLAPPPKRRGTLKRSGAANGTGAETASPTSYAASPEE
ncbi:purine catabolism protein PucB [Corallococcus praedator]|uniref:Purine catabolism protein PucB n=1 Tax=Corallococcus praedator TaxID=2316724 RepID=A0ABX9QGN7_9BACT|nr:MULTISPECIES: NTP transferase domain-containing protein [Corallococcus]RKH31719.1 purine catabolism protein PucB [Corallococcus sp. CA031C]RKI07458.1 purine catabolism protein PucB [Corallococcus praedator]